MPEAILRLHPTTKDTRNTLNIVIDDFSKPLEKIGVIVRFEVFFSNQEVSL